MYGMAGKILRINLSNNTTSTFDSGPYVRNYLGGRGIASRLYWEEVPPEVKPFDPENKLIFINGLLVGTGAQAATVMAVTGKSPAAYPDGYCYGFLTGFVGAELKKAGYDGFIIEGCAAQPVYIWINDDKVEIRPADSVWGKRAYSSAEMLLQEHGQDAKYIAIGVSGEKRVRTSVALASHESTLSCGFAAVMGSKNLKAVVIKGSRDIPAANPDKIVEINRYSYKISQRVHLSMPPQILNSGHAHLLEAIGKDSCFKCGSTCQRNLYRYGKRKDLVAPRRCQSIEYYLPWLYGHEDEPIETLFDAPALANDYALETFELETVIRWLYACYQTGALTEEETGLPLSKMGTRAFLEKLLYSIAYREDFGDILAEGQVRAGAKVPAKAKALYSTQVNAIGQYETSPTRKLVVQSLMIPMEPRAHQPLLHAQSFVLVPWNMNRMDPASSPIDTKIYQAVAKLFWGSEEAGDVSSYAGKPLAAVLIQDRVYIHDSLGLCNFTWPITYSFATPDHLGDPRLEGRLFSAVTGLPEDQIWEYGKRIVDLQRAILMREGRNIAAADFPREHVFSEPLTPNMPQWVPGPNGPLNVSGNKLDKEKHKGMLQEFYKLRGWDPQTGLPVTPVAASLS